MKKIFYSQFWTSEISVVLHFVVPNFDPHPILILFRLEKSVSLIKKIIAKKDLKNSTSIFIYINIDNNDRLSISFPLSRCLSIANRKATTAQRDIYPGNSEGSARWMGCRDVALVYIAAAVTNSETGIVSHALPVRLCIANDFEAQQGSHSSQRGSRYSQTTSGYRTDRSHTATGSCRRSGWRGCTAYRASWYHRDCHPEIARTSDGTHAGEEKTRSLHPRGFAAAGESSCIPVTRFSSCKKIFIKFHIK